MSPHAARASELLPPEIYEAIIEHLPPEELQTAILSFTRALPISPISLHRLYQHVALRSARSVVNFNQCLRKRPALITYIETFSLETWDPDADVTVNLMALLSPQIRQLHMFIGTTFAPEHLEEIFSKPMQRIKIISLRFRPYVQKATYYQFHAGSYFDSTLFALSRWPEDLIPSLSIIQDPLDMAIAPKGKFAQPMVFFRLDSVTKLCCSSFLRDTKHLRLRIPSRQIARFIYSNPLSLPSITLLDLSTCHVVEADVEHLLGRLRHLEHLVLDGSPILSQRTDLQEDENQVQWMNLGKTLAIAGIRVAREREKKLKAWLEMNPRALTDPTAPGTVEMQQQVQKGRVSGHKKVKKGRKGLSTPTISLRESTQTDTPGPTPSASINPAEIPRIRILPPLPSIRTFCTNTPGENSIERQNIIKADFELGWAEGIAQLVSKRSLIKASWKNGTGMKVMFFAEDFDEEELEEIGAEIGLAGLDFVSDEKMFDMGNSDICPVLCLAGVGRKDVEHSEGCGHSFGWKAWNDEL
ncbi:hypothetical protein C8Q75DRAFT_809518 [Abortiporus biennis]|nr:hypothetical protein C8Q75DRAFT_809518 [Abortiporus biennis]